MAEQEFVAGVEGRVPHVSILRHGFVTVDVSYGMTRGLSRYQLTGDVHFVTFSCYHRLPYLGSPSARDRFLQSLEAMRIRYQFLVLGYVVMPEHVHLLMSEPKMVLLAKAIQALKLSVSVKRKEQAFWQAHYYDFNVFTERKVTEKLKYMHRNPVKRGLTTVPEDWMWSSFRHYLTGEIGVVEVESFWTAQRRSCGGVDTQVSEARPGAPASVVKI